MPEPQKVRHGKLPEPGPAWMLMSTPPRLTERDVHVWVLNLTLTSHALASLIPILSEDEHERAERFRFPIHRNRFIAGRAQMRAILGTYLQKPPDALRFSVGPAGKPELDSGRLHFNLSHSEHLGLLAVTRMGPVGVDIERIRPLGDAGELVARFFSPRESLAYAALPDELQPHAFFNLWTRKESWLKATGEGIGHCLHLAEVSFVPGEPARLLALPRDLKPRDWTLRDLIPAPGFVGAMSVHGSPRNVIRVRWPEPVSKSSFL